MARDVRGLVGVVLLLVLVVPVWAQQLKVTVSPERASDGKLTGNYDAAVTVVSAATAREVSFGLNIPTAYTVDTDAYDIRIVAVKSGADVALIDANTPETPADTSDDTPVLFAETTVGSGTTDVSVVALLKDDATATTKKVCDVIFTARGRATTANVTFDTVAVKDASLVTLVSAGTFAGAQVPLFGDFNWDGKVSALDFAVFAQAWREYNSTGTDKALADLNPRQDPTVTDPRTMLSTGDNKVNALDFSAFALAWREYNKNP
jgi:hypothetical protein